jgi:hypothetical protein
MNNNTETGRVVAMDHCGGCAKAAAFRGYGPWVILRVLLFEHLGFSLDERTKAKMLVAANLQKVDLVTFLERVLLHRQREGQLSCPASFFLDPYNALGFVRSSAWMRDLEAMREKLPSYNLESRALAEALAEMITDPSRKTFRYWQYYFTERKAFESLALFTKASGYLTYGID